MAFKKERTSGSSFFRSRVFLGLLCIGASLLLFLAGTFLPQFTGRQITVVLLTEDVAKGQVIPASAVRTQTVFASSVASANPLTDPSAAAGKYAAADLYAGDLLTPAKLSPVPTYNDPVLYDLPEGKLAISISVDSLEEGVADKLLPGDVVTVYAVPDDLYDPYASDLPVIQYPELHYLKVLCVTDLSGCDVDNAYRIRGADQTAGSGATAAVTFEVNEKQALRLAAVQARGHFHLALAARGSGAASCLSLQEQYFRDLELLEAVVPAAEEGDGTEAPHV